jgi:hypothetical protein
LHQGQELLLVVVECGHPSFRSCEHEVPIVHIAPNQR